MKKIFVIIIVLFAGFKGFSQDDLENKSYEKKI